MNGVIGNSQVIIKFMVIVLGLINAFENMYTIIILGIQEIIDSQNVLQKIVLLNRQRMFLFFKSENKLFCFIKLMGKKKIFRKQ